MRLHAVCSKHPIARIPCGVKVNYKIKGSVFNACESGGRESGGRGSRATDFGAGEPLSGGRQSGGFGGFYINTIIKKKKLLWGLIA